MVRLINLPVKTYEAVRYKPSGLVLRSLAKFPPTKSPRPRPSASGWTPYRLDDPTGVLNKHPDGQLQNLITIIFAPNPPEYAFRDYVAGLYPDSQTEVILESGIVDVMTDELVIEVKLAKHWKHALGQALAYSIDSRKSPVVALVGYIPPIAKQVLGEIGVGVLALPGPESERQG